MMNATELKTLARYIVDEMESRGLIEDKYMSIEEVSDLLHIPVNTLYKSKHIPRRKVGKRLLFSQRDVFKWLNR